MSFLKYRNPKTSSLREVCLLKKNEIIKRKTLKSHQIFKNNAGRNNVGRLTIFTKGGGHKKCFKKNLVNIPFFEGIVESIEYDAYRTASIARIYSKNLNKHFYILAPLGLKRGHFISSQIINKELIFSPGNSFFLKNLPIGSLIYNIPFLSVKKIKKTYAIRAAGCSGLIVTRNGNFSKIRLPSGNLKIFSSNSLVFLGSLSNPLHKRIVLGKAGRSRWLNKRPCVRGVAMNPIDHPHGGGQGKTSGGRPSCTPWGKLTKGQPTKKKKKSI